MSEQHTITPPCWNRPPFAEGRTLHGIDEQTGEAITVELRNDWFEDRCTQHDGRGIGPNGESFADANGYNCTGCRWNPKER